MRIQTEYMSIKNYSTISSSDDFQGHQHCSRRKCCFSQIALLWLEALPDLWSALKDAARILHGAPRFVGGSPKCTQCSLRPSEVVPNLSQSLPLPSCSCHQISQLLWRPNGMPSQGVIVSWNWRFKVYTPHPLRHSWRLGVTIMDFAYG